MLCHRGLVWSAFLSALLCADATVLMGAKPVPGMVAIAPLRGGEGPALRRQLSHHDIAAELHGTTDTADARVYAKDIVEGEHRSLWHDLPLFELDLKENKPTGALNFVCEIPKWTRFPFCLSP